MAGEFADERRHLAEGEPCVGPSEGRLVGVGMALRGRDNLADADGGPRLRAARGATKRLGARGGPLPAGLLHGMCRVEDDRHLFSA